MSDYYVIRCQWELYECYEFRPDQSVHLIIFLEKLYGAQKVAMDGARDRHVPLSLPYC